ncbi:MAG TPA: NUDIX hydrolase [bacterium]|nr:NUDIX hydrolase [bacterium]
MPAPVTPPVAVDIIIPARTADGRDGVVLIERRNPPPGWALPGGFVDAGESCEQAAVREAGEETGLAVTLLGQLATYSAPGRDPRGHSISVVLIAAPTAGQPRGMDDARQAAICALDELPALAFDHDRLLADYRAWRNGRLPALIARP